MDNNLVSIITSDTKPFVSIEDIPDNYQECLHVKAKGFLVPFADFTFINYSGTKEEVAKFINDNYGDLVEDVLKDTSK